MDFSYLDPSDPLYDASRKNVVGFLKNESPDEITAFVGLKAKTYAFCTQTSKVESRCKGVKKSVKRDLKFDDFLQCIENKKVKHVTQHTLNSKDHINRLLKAEKIAFSSFDDKKNGMCGTTVTEIKL